MKFDILMTPVKVQDNKFTNLLSTLAIPKSPSFIIPSLVKNIFCNEKKKKKDKNKSLENCINN